MSDHYEVLELSADCTDIAIKKAFRRLALVWHPDKNPKDGGERFRRMREAFEILRDSAKRKEYDLLRAAPEEPEPPPEPVVPPAAANAQGPADPMFDFFSFFERAMQDPQFADPNMPNLAQNFFNAPHAKSHPEPFSPAPDSSNPFPGPFPQMNSFPFDFFPAQDPKKTQAEALLEARRKKAREEQRKRRLAKARQRQEEEEKKTRIKKTKPQDSSEDTKSEDEEETSKKRKVDTETEPQCCICASVATELSSALQSHPVLKIPICESCLTTYEKDQESSTIDEEDGSESLCTMCADGGELLCCDSCPKAFCVDCLGSLGANVLKKARAQKKWECLLCSPNQEIKFLQRSLKRVQARAARELKRKREAKAKAAAGTTAPIDQFFHPQPFPMNFPDGELPHFVPAFPVPATFSAAALPSFPTSHPSFPASHHPSFPSAHPSFPTSHQASFSASHQSSFSSTQHSFSATHQVSFSTFHPPPPYSVPPPQPLPSPASPPPPFPVPPPFSPSPPAQHWFLQPETFQRISHALRCPPDMKALRTLQELLVSHAELINDTCKQNHISDPVQFIVNFIQNLTRPSS